MLQESGPMAGFREAPQTHPELSGWAGPATAIHALGQMALPMTLRLHVEAHGTMAIDFAHNAYAWTHTLAEFPRVPASVELETSPAPADGSAPFALPGRTLDPLLWLIGLNAFGDSPAPWLTEDERFRLRRWPNLTELDVPLDQVRVIAMFGNTFATPHEVAAAANLDVREVNRMVNGFSAMGILRR